LEIQANFSDDIVNISTFNDNESLELGSSETDNVSLTFDVFTVDDYDGEMTLTGNSSDYSKTVDIEIDSPDCQIVNGSLCIDRDSRWINLTATETGSITRTVTVEYLGGTSSFVSTSVNGNVSDYLTFDPTSETIFSQTDFVLNYTPRRIGAYRGDLAFEGSENTITLHTKFESEVQDLSPGISSSSTLDLSSAVRGTDVEKQVSLTNTGDSHINSLSASSSTFDVDIESVEIPLGESKTTSVTITNIQSSTGEIEIEASTDAGSVTTTISTSGTIINYEDRIDTLNNRITTLQEEAESQEVLNSLSDLSMDISQLETMYQQGNNEEANQEYNRIQSELDQIEFDIGDSGTPNPPPSNNGTDEGPPSTDDDGGGGLLIIVAVVVFVLLIAGFIVYTSYIPEPGDPLYDLLGEE